MSRVNEIPSKSNAVKEPAEELRPPIILPEPSCSKSIFAVAPDWSTYISLSAAKIDVEINNTLINIFIDYLPETFIIPYFDDLQNCFLDSSL